MANFIAQSAVLVSIVMLLFIVQPILTLIICLTLGLSFALIFYFSKNVLKRLGSEHLKQNAKRFAIVSEAFGAVKEIKARFWLNKISDYWQYQEAKWYNWAQVFFKVKFIIFYWKINLYFY